jgi:predicted methyltransferase
MRVPTLLSLLLFAVACGGSQPASVPPKLDIPIMPPPKPPGPARQGAPAPAGGTSSQPVRPSAQQWTVPPPVLAVVGATDRTDDDKKLDGGRHAGELLAFLGLPPGARVADLGAGGGYTTELLARDVGPKGKVWAQNNKFVVDRFADKPLTARLAKPVNKNVVRVDREFDAPLPPEAKDLDAVVMVLFYHDTVWLNADRDKMNKAVFDALKHGGEYVVVDHSSVEGRGTTDSKTLHRIDELAVIREVERAGFHHVTSADFMRNPSDSRDWNDSPGAAGDRRGTSDRFVLKFVRP